MLDSFSDKLNGIFRQLRGQGRITEDNVKDAIRELRFSLLDADVNFEVVKAFIGTVREKAMGEEVLKSLTPGQQFFKIVRDALIDLLGGQSAPLAKPGRDPVPVLMVGLQGAGKTTTAAKLAVKLTKDKKKTLLTPLDIKRPAAIEQLRILAERNDLDFYFPDAPGLDPVAIARDAAEYAARYGYDYLLLDTAGRQHVDEGLMAEARDIAEAVNPKETLLVVDGMTGQEAVSIAEAFSKIGVTGLVLTKMDGDTRGGAALSIKYVAGIPIKFIGVGEKTDALEDFHPDRFVSRILGMGDMMSFLEKVERNIDVEEAKRLEKRLRQDSFTFEDFLTQLQQVKKMGNIGNLLGMIPGLGGLQKKLPADLADKQLRRVEAIVHSMTRTERLHPHILNASRKRRVAKGSGATVQEVNQLLKQFEMMKKTFQQFSKGKFPKALFGKGVN